MIHRQSVLFFLILWICVTSQVLATSGSSPQTGYEYCLDVGQKNHDFRWAVQNCKRGSSLFYGHCVMTGYENGYFRWAVHNCKPDAQTGYFHCIKMGNGKNSLRWAVQNCQATGTQAYGDCVETGQRNGSFRWAVQNCTVSTQNNRTDCLTAGFFPIMMPLPWTTTFRPKGPRRSTKPFDQDNASSWILPFCSD